jgi:hypothetical protein
MRRNLIRRIDKLEQLWSAPEGARSPLVLCIEREHETELAPGEHMVQDWFRDCGSVVWARDRVTTQTAEGGRRCPPGGYLLDVLEDFNQRCPWRQRTEVCQMCQGTPVGDQDRKSREGLAR